MSAREFTGSIVRCPIAANAQANVLTASVSTQVDNTI
jgi:hypothetical protein